MLLSEKYDAGGYRECKSDEYSQLSHSPQVTARSSPGLVSVAARSSLVSLLVEQQSPMAGAGVGSEDLSANVVTAEGQAKATVVNH